MMIAQCVSCDRKTGFKRAFGFGTFFAVVLTGGFWLLLLPLYPKRCVVCGLKRGALTPFPWVRAIVTTAVVFGVIFVIAAIFGHYALHAHSVGGESGGNLSHNSVPPAPALAPQTSTSSDPVPKNIVKIFHAMMQEQQEEANHAHPAHSALQLSCPAVRYTDEAIKEHVTGHVLLTFMVDTQGIPENIVVTKGLGDGLDEMAVKGVMQCRFLAATDANGLPTPSEQSMNVNFTITP